MAPGTPIFVAVALACTNGSEDGSNTTLYISAFDWQNEKHRPKDIRVECMAVKRIARDVICCCIVVDARNIGERTVGKVR